MQEFLKFYMLIKFLLFDVSTSQSVLRQSNFKLIKNVQVSLSFDNFNLFSSFSSKNKMNCYAKCNQMADACLMAISVSSNCSLYGSSVSLQEMIPASTSEVKLFKKVESNCFSNQFFDGISCCKF
jgi:hypothetical protein